VNNKSELRVYKTGRVGLLSVAGRKGAGTALLVAAKYFNIKIESEEHLLISGGCNGLRIVSSGVAFLLLADSCA
jgi:hypothetical protein